MVWNINGDGKTVLKGSYSRYDLTPGDEHASAYNPNVATITTYRWAGPSFGRITTISTPIIARLGMTYFF